MCSVAFFFTDTPTTVIYTLSLHDALPISDNAFPGWQAYNEMIGVGGWRGRREQAGPYWFVKEGKLTSDASAGPAGSHGRSEEHTSELQSRLHLVCRLLLEKKKQQKIQTHR